MKSKKINKIVDSFENQSFLEEELEKSYDEFKSNSIDLNIEPETLKVNGTVYMIIEGFIVFETLAKHPFIKIIYDKLKVPLVKTFGNTWYFELCSFASTNRNKKTQKFPGLLLKFEKINEKIIKIRNEIELKGLFKKIRREELGFLNKIICRLITNDVFGFPPFKKKRNSFVVISDGESMFADPTEIQEINSQRRLEAPPGLFGPAYSMIETYNNKKLPRWLDYKIENGVLIFFGTPGEADVCEYKINIINEIGMKLRVFSVNVFEPKEKDNNDSINAVLIDEGKAEVMPSLEDKIKLNCLTTPLHNKENEKTPLTGAEMKIAEMMQNSE